MRSSESPSAFSSHFALSFRSGVSFKRPFDCVTITTSRPGPELVLASGRYRVEARYAGSNVRSVREFELKGGQTLPLLSQDEVDNLSISRGTLTNAERLLINSHMVQTVRMLEALPFPRQLRRVLAPRRGERILDVGQGLGVHALPIAAAVGADGVLNALDIQHEMLAIIEQRKAQLKVDNVVAIQGTETDVKLPAASVDVVFFADVYHEFSYPREMMESILRALKPGGRVIQIDRRIDINHEFIVYSRFFASERDLGSLLKCPLNKLDGQNFKMMIADEMGLPITSINNHARAQALPDRAAAIVDVSPGAMGLYVQAIAASGRRAIYMQDFFIPPTDRLLVLSPAGEANGGRGTRR